MICSQPLRRLSTLIKGEEKVFICHPIHMCNIENGDGRIYKVAELPKEWLNRWCENYWYEDGDLCIIFKGDNR